MLKAMLEIHFLSDWHIGSGLGDGALADAVLNRDARGIPCIPGTAVKGALREGSWRLALCQPDLAPLTSLLFGTASAERVSNQPGRVITGQANLPEGLRTWLLEQKDIAACVSDMTIIRQQTRLDAQKRIVPHTLRSIECGIPGLVFTASIEVDAPDCAHAWLMSYLGAVCSCVKSIGAHRSRGIGRCRLALNGKTAAGLPGKMPDCLQTLVQQERDNANS